MVTESTQPGVAAPTAPHASSADEWSIAPGQRIRQYEVIRELGRGGMGRVMLARDTRLGRRVAMKFLATDSDELTARFLVEARTTAALNHENIVVIHEVEELDGIAGIWCSERFWRARRCGSSSTAIASRPAAPSRSRCRSCARWSVRTKLGSCIATLEARAEQWRSSHDRRRAIKALDSGIGEAAPRRDRAPGGARGRRPTLHTTTDILDLEKRARRNAAVHVARAARRRRDRSSIGSVGRRHHAVRDGHRSAPAAADAGDEVVARRRAAERSRTSTQTWRLPSVRRYRDRDLLEHGSRNEVIDRDADAA